jgi:predicted RNase H-like HicB family nuclease
VTNPMTPDDFLAACGDALVFEWSDEGQCFIASAPDLLPDAWTMGATRAEAACMGEEAIASVLPSFANAGVPAPESRLAAPVDELDRAAAAT